MKDELERSKTDLLLEGFDKPFYISYGVNDTRTLSIVSTLGAIMRTNDVKSRAKDVRVLAGGYDFNDESLDDNLFSSPQAVEIEVPLDDDYFGIRRAFWSTTDGVYKNASRQFKKNSGTLKDQSKPLSDIPHRSFAKTPVVKLSIPGQAYDIDIPRLENYLREVSAVFLRYPDVYNSGTMLDFHRGASYLVNSEGSSVQTPISIAMIQINAQTRNEKGEISFDRIVHFASAPDQLPSSRQLIKETEEMVERLTQKQNGLVEEYSGPVLFVGPAVAETLGGCLFGPRESLEANNTIVSLTGSMRPESMASLETKLGKTIAPESMTVKSMATTKTFGDEVLLGSYDADSEGVIPQDMTLIENGILRGMLNDRTITSPNQTANGHRSGPGVVSVTFSGAVTREDLKEKLLSEAKKEGLDFALMIKDFSFGQFVSVYKVTPDGKEELLRPATFSGLTLRNLRKLLGVANGSMVWNLQSRESVAGVASWIVPPAILVGDISIVPANLPYMKEVTYVANPLKK
jgi:PmbA/TldA metallopeptidase C-terminal domain